MTNGKYRHVKVSLNLPSTAEEHSGVESNDSLESLFPAPTWTSVCNSGPTPKDPTLSSGLCEQQKRKKKLHKLINRLIYINSIKKVFFLKNG